VAERLAEYLAGVQERLRRAELGQARAEARVEGERTRRRLAVGLAAAVLAVVALGGGTLLLVQRHQAEQAGEQARRQQAGESALARAGDLQQQGRWDEALTLLEQTRQRLDERDGPINREVQQAVLDLELVRRLEKVRLQAATVTGGSFAKARADREYELEFATAGLGGPDELAEAVAERVRASGVRAALVAALDAWAMTTEDPRRRDWAQAVARSADPGDDWGRRLRASWADPAALEALAREAPIDRVSPHLLAVLANALVCSRREAVPLLRKAQLQYPGDFWLTLLLAMRLGDEGQLAEAAGFYRVALSIRPDATAVLVNLGNALQALNKLDQACDCYRRAIHLDPKEAMPHNNLGNTLRAIGQLDEAIDCYREAVKLDPRNAMYHYDLGLALNARRKVEEAIDCYHKAIELNPKYAATYTGLGNALRAKRKVEEAIDCYHKAIAIDPKDAAAYTCLGNALMAKRKVEEAIDCYHKAIAINPNNAMPYYNLGNALMAKGQPDEAIDRYRKAIAIAPSFPEALCNLGDALKARGDFAEALESLRRGDELGHKRGNWPFRSDLSIRDCEQLIEREKQLLGVLGGSSEPANARERIEWVPLCLQTRRYVAAARLSGEAFRADPKLADDLAAGRRGRAAAAAALAGVGQGRDAGDLTDKARAALRTQALDWLKADLAAWRGHSDESRRARALRIWRADLALAGVRDEKGLAKLPPAERAAWGKFWAEVEKLLKPER
jgi:tetratricopeptide (TPR) repeat protein